MGYCGKGTYDVFVREGLHLFEGLYAAESGLDGVAVGFQLGADAGEVDDPAFGCSHEGEEGAVHLALRVLGLAA